ncbi:MAG: hypothetical protein JW821_20185 [Deltaproteobacteria bacterium]|nr:hypothetical protein [Deltaproteobacteria bacterium]
MCARGNALAPLRNRQSIRLKRYDYSWPGGYFVTMCVQDRKCLFGDIRGGEMVLNDAGRMVQKWCGELNNKFPDIQCDEYIIMPNHFHAIIQNVGADLRVCPDLRVCSQNEPNENGAGEHRTGEHVGSPLHVVVQWFKTMTTNEYIRGVKRFHWMPFHGKLWQRNYYEHVIRNENEWNRIRDYITRNPMRWETDRENPNRA